MRFSRWNSARHTLKGFTRVVLLMGVLLGPSLPPKFGAATLAANTAEKPDVILISVDTLRADHLNCYGYRALRTPHINGLAQHGTLFTQVSAQIPLTLPSHVSMLTSTYPFANGVEDNVEQLGSNAVTLASVLKAQGYRTAAFVGGFVLDQRFGLNRGFDLYDSPFNLCRQEGKDPGDIKRRGEEVARSAEKWLEQNSVPPFFLFLHLYDLHTPYDLPPARHGHEHGSGYDAELAYVDEVVGEFRDFLARRGLFDRALVVFTSDHGESLGEHGESTHGYFIYQSTLRVPLIIHWPAGGNLSAARVDEPVSLLDIAPTVLQFLDVPRPAEFQGRTLLALARSKSRSNAPAGVAEEIYSESLYGRNHFGTSSLRCLRVGALKYIEAPQPELYDLASDPTETQNLYGTRKSLAASFRDRLQALRSRFQPSGKAVAPHALTPEAIERLNSLGYMAVSGSRSNAPDSGPDPKERIEEYESFGRAIATANAGHLAEAAAVLRRLLQRDPDLPDVRLTLGQQEQKLGRRADAAENFRQILKNDPLNATAHFNLAVSEFELGQLDPALKELEAALAIAPYYTRAENLLATIYLQRKEYDRARPHLQHVLTVDPGDYEAQYNLGVLATKEGSWQQGEQHLQAALKSDPLSAEAHNALGSLYLKRGDVERASEEFREAVRLQPIFAWGHFNLGLALREQNKLDEAAREFRRALDADPHFQPARSALDRLRTVER